MNCAAAGTGFNHGPPAEHEQIARRVLQRDIEHLAIAWNCGLMRAAATDGGDNGRERHNRTQP